MLINRRRFLGQVVAAAALAGCQRTASGDVRLAMVPNAVPAQLVRAFQQGPAGTSVAIAPQSSVAALYGQLQRWQGEGDAASWVSLPDYWLAPAIASELVQPIDVSALSPWDDLAPLWSDLVRRDRLGQPAAGNDAWAVPYRWDHLALVYNPSRLPQEPVRSWADLLRPAFARRVILPDHPRLVLGLAQKALGQSANAAEPEAIAALTPFLDQLRPQVRVYDSTHTLEPLVLGDADAAVAWSDDLAPLLRQYRHLAAVTPAEGTLLSAQLWVRPAAAPAQDAASLSWLEFCLSDAVTDPLAIYGDGRSPRLWATDPNQWPESLRRPPGLVLPTAVAAQSEFLLPLSQAASDRYAELWRSLRT